MRASCRSTLRRTNRGLLSPHILPSCALVRKSLKLCKINKGFLSPKLRGSFWINPTLFFKGDRVAFITEYRRNKETEQDRLEQEGQQRLIK
jgi:hypothetical protein